MIHYSEQVGERKHREYIKRTSGLKKRNARYYKITEPSGNQFVIDTLEGVAKYFGYSTGTVLTRIKYRKPLEGCMIERVYEG